MPRIKHHNCIRSSITKTLYLIKKASGAHFCSTIENFPLEATSLEKTWQSILTDLNPQINHIQSHKFIYKLLIHNIYNIKHLTLANGTNLMFHEDFKHYYTTPTKLIKQSLDMATQLYCHPSCNLNRPNPCPNHHPPCTLKQEYITIDHNIESRNRETPIHPSIPPHPKTPLNIKKQPNKIPYQLNNKP